MTRGVGLSHFDDFNHWYRVCNIIDLENALPSTPDVIYPTYVPGTALWIYLFTRVTGFGVHAVFLAQMLIHISCCTALFALEPRTEDRGTRVLYFALVCVLSVVLCAMDYTSYCLLVDGTLGLTALAGILMLMTREDRVPLPCLVPLACFLGIMKTSGLLLAFFLLLYVLLCRPCGRREKLLSAGTLVGLPVILFALYQLYAGLTFGDAGSSNHAVSVTRWLSVLAERSGSNISDTILNFMSKLFGVQSSIGQIRVLWFCLLLMTLLAVWRKQRGLRDTGCARWCRYSFIIYFILLLLTYLFSMSSTEANARAMACWNRYTGTIAILLGGVTAARCIQLAGADAGKLRLRLTAGLAAVILLGAGCFDIGYIWGKDHGDYFAGDAGYNDKGWNITSATVPQQTEYNEKVYLVVYREKDFSVGLQWIPVYQTLLRSVHTVFWSLEDVQAGKVPADVTANAGSFDYLVTPDDYTHAIDAIRRVVDVPEYTPGICAISGAAE